MDRRAFLVAGVGCASASISLAQAQRRSWRIGLLGSIEQAGTPWLQTFRQGMRDLGHVEGSNYVLEIKWARGDPERARRFAAELVRLNSDLIITQGSEAAQAAKEATRVIPIVFFGPSYPVEEGLVASFARPGANLTGFTVAMSDTVSKHLQLLMDVAPPLTDVAVIWSPANPGHRVAFRDTERAADTARLKIRSVPMNGTQDLPAVLARLELLAPGAMIVQPTAALANEHVQQISAVAIKLRIPSISTFRSLARQGLLMAYGPDVSDGPKRIASFVDRIIKGAKPADLPVERPTKFELVINMSTARAVGLTIPPSILLRADEVIR